jgi:DNA invertase Pin-like site-specific DNA recombinase
VNSLLIISGVAPFRAQPFDTGNIYGELTVSLLGCFAELETNLRKERQAEGIAKAKAAGVYKGRPPSS